MANKALATRQKMQFRPSRVPVQRTVGGPPPRPRGAAVPAGARKPAQATPAGGGKTDREEKD
ncbi:hypothetical protein HSX11_11710 [Oxalobacteraceae bacterium]|nr:hypothetical protein [Oxalobacteraceae bacterium]